MSIGDVGESACHCLRYGTHAPHASTLRDVGRDESLGRYASVDIIRCDRCGRCWLRYLHEEEFRRAAGRWAEALIDLDQIDTVLAGDAANYIGHANFRIVGGSTMGISVSASRDRAGRP